MIRELWEDELTGTGFGPCSLRLYESTGGLAPWQLEEPPYVVVWLHGMHHGPIHVSELEKMQRRLWHRVIYLVPLSPSPSEDGMLFSWGCTFTKTQNRKDLGYVNGDLHRPFLEALTSKVTEAAEYFNAERVMAMGYSMGGFGALQLGSFAPQAYDAIVSVAGYGMGTLEPTERSGAPQPKGRKVFEWFLNESISHLRDVPIVLGVHAPADTMSSFADVSAIMSKVEESTRWYQTDNVTKLVEVPDELANSDYPKKRKKKAGHGYFNCSLIKDRSEEFLWQPLRELLQKAPPRQILSWKKKEPQSSFERSRPDRKSVV